MNGQVSNRKYEVAEKVVEALSEEEMRSYLPVALATLWELSTVIDPLTVYNTIDGILPKGATLDSIEAVSVKITVERIKARKAFREIDSERN